MSIDTGNKMMKTNHFIFHSGIKRKEQKILPGEEGIFYKGINYLESNQRISYLEDKTIDDRYYILTLLGVAKELEKEGIETGIYEGGTIPIQLLVGLPRGFTENRSENSGNIFGGKEKPFIFPIKENHTEYAMRA